MGRKPNEPSRTKKPSFFKIMCGDFRNTIKLPSAFTDRYGTELKTKSILKDPTGTWWYVKVKKNDDCLFFKNNWPRIVESNSLEYGDVLIFTYRGHSSFIVKIYDRTECEKDMSSAKNKFEEKEGGSQRASVAGNARNTAHQGGACGGDSPDASEDDLEYQPTTKNRPAKIASSTIKRRKLNSENLFVSKNQGRSDSCLERSEPSPGHISSRKPKQLSKHGKAVEIPKENKLYEGEKMDSDIELILVDSDSDSEETNNLEASVSSGTKNRAASLSDEETESFRSEENKLYQGEKMDSDIELILVDSDSDSEETNNLEASVLSGTTNGAASLSDEETQSFRSEVACRNEDQEELDSPILAESETAENPSYEVCLSHSYVSQGFLYLPNKLQIYLKKIYLKKIHIGISVNKKGSIRLWISDDKSWSVRYGFMSINPRLRKGWKEFVVDNNLVKGDVCIFQLMKTGKLDFRVLVQRVSEQLKPILTENETAENPSYEVRLSQSYVSKGFLYLPNKLQIYLKKILFGISVSKKGTVRLWISDDRSWSVRYSFKSINPCLHKGWKEFVADNNLVKGDVCIFQLMKTGKLDFRVLVRTC